MGERRDGISLRAEAPGDVREIRRLNELVFAGPAEGAIVDAIRASCPEAVSLVAVEGARIVGHIFFSPVRIEGGGGIRAMALGPMAVLPEAQRRGIGSSLVTAGLRRLREAGCELVVVLGHAEYYPRFGFVPASRLGLRCPWEGVPDAVFMAIFLDPARAGAVAGTVRYPREFDAAFRESDEFG